MSVLASRPFFWAGISAAGDTPDPAHPASAKMNRPLRIDPCHIMCPDPPRLVPGHKGRRELPQHQLAAHRNHGKTNCARTTAKDENLCRHVIAWRATLRNPRAMLQFKSSIPR